MLKIKFINKKITKIFLVSLLLFFGLILNIFSVNAESCAPSDWSNQDTGAIKACLDFVHGFETDNSGNVKFPYYGEVYKSGGVCHDGSSAAGYYQITATTYNEVVEGTSCEKTVPCVFETNNKDGECKNQKRRCKDEVNGVNFYDTTPKVMTYDEESQRYLAYRVFTVAHGISNAEIELNCLGSYCQGYHTGWDDGDLNCKKMPDDQIKRMKRIADKYDVQYDESIFPDASGSTGNSIDHNSGGSTPTFSDNYVDNAAGGMVTCSGSDCGFNDFMVMIANIMKFMVKAGYLIFSLVIIYAGLKLVTSGGDTQAMSDAKKMLKNAVTGLVIMAAAHGIIWFIVNLLLDVNSDLVGNNPILRRVFPGKF